MSEFTVPTHLPDWIQEHVRRYLESEGADGHMWDSSLRGVPRAYERQIPVVVLEPLGE
jgi:hypothetical protein